MDLTDAEDIKKRGREYTEELYKKDLHDPDNHDGVITHLKSDILECEVLLKILQARLQQYMNRVLPDVQVGFTKGRGTRDQIANIHWIIRKAREFQKKTSISALLTIPKHLTMWITINWKIMKETGLQDHLTHLLRKLYAG